MKRSRTHESRVAEEEAIREAKKPCSSPQSGPDTSLSEEIGVENFNSLTDELLMRIFLIMPDASWVDIVAIGRVNKRLHSITQANSIWLRQFYRVLQHRVEGDMVSKFYSFIQWLDVAILRAAIHSMLRVFHKDTINQKREYILFKEGTSEDALTPDHHHQYSNVVVARLGLGLEETEAIYVSGVTSSTQENTICQLLAEILNNAFKSLLDALLCSQRVSDADENNGYTLRPLLQIFDGRTLWYQLFKLCVLDQQYLSCATASWANMIRVYDDLSTVQSKEIAAMISNGTSVPNSREDVPTIWQRPSESVVKDKLDYPRCYTCTRPYPTTINQHVTAAMRIINRFTGTNAHGFCSTSCLLKGISEFSGLTINCANPQCYGTVAMRNAYHLTLAEVNTRRSNKVVVTTGISVKNISVPLDVLTKDYKADLIDNVLLLGHMGQQINRERCALAGIKSRDWVLDQAPVDEFATVVDPSTRVDHKYYITLLPHDALATKACGAAGLSNKAWDMRLETYRLIRGKLEGSDLPWAFIGAGLPAINMFFAMPLITCTDVAPVLDVESRAMVTLPGTAKAYCNVACMHHTLSGKPSAKPPCTFVRCLNRQCTRVFNIAHAALTMECFELFYQSKQARINGSPPRSRGYVCDYICYDKYVDERTLEIRSMKAERMKSSRPVVEDS